MGAWLYRRAMFKSLSEPTDIPALLPKFPRLTSKQKKFVKAMATGRVTQTQAVLDAGYQPKDRKVANVMGGNIMRSPKVQNALAEALKVQFPNGPQVAAEVIMGILTDMDVRPSDKLKAIELLARVCGWQEPTKHSSVNLSISDKFRLPEE